MKEALRSAADAPDVRRQHFEGGWMSVFGILIFILGLILLAMGLSGGGVGATIMGLAILIAIWRFRASRKRNTTLLVLEMGYPGSSADISLSGPWETIGTLFGVPVELAPKAVADVWIKLRYAYPRRRVRMGAVVRDQNGQYWGTDWLRMNPPNSQLQFVSGPRPWNVLERVAIKVGSLRVGADGNLYRLIPAPPWGPLPSPAPIGFGLPLEDAATHADIPATQPSAESEAPRPTQ